LRNSEVWTNWRTHWQTKLLALQYTFRYYGPWPMGSSDYGISTQYVVKTTGQIYQSASPMSYIIILIRISPTTQQNQTKRILTPWRNHFLNLVCHHILTIEITTNHVKTTTSICRLRHYTGVLISYGTGIIHSQSQRLVLAPMGKRIIAARIFILHIRLRFICKTAMRQG
jgi:hypothetical protein